MGNDGDNTVEDEKEKRRLLCGTEKGRHRCKNDRSAGEQR